MAYRTIAARWARPLALAFTLVLCCTATACGGGGGASVSPPATWGQLVWGTDAWTPSATP